MTRVVAGYNGHVLAGFGVRTAEFDSEPVFPLPWHPPLYAEVLSAAGYRRTYPWWSYCIDFSSDAHRKASARAIRDARCVVRPIDKKRWAADLEIAIRRVPAGDTGRAAAVAGYAEFMLIGLEYHHTSEDDYLWPRLRERAAPDAGLVNRMGEQHEAVHGPIERARVQLSAWRARPLGSELADTIEELRIALTAHLDEEEAEILPLVRAHITAAEWQELGDLSFAKFTNNEKLIALGQMLDVASPSEAAMFFGKLPLPIRLMWRLAGRRRYARYMAGVRGDR